VTNYTDLNSSIVAGNRRRSTKVNAATANKSLMSIVYLQRILGARWQRNLLVGQRLLQDRDCRRRI
jgi:hypothetical protein